MPDNVQGPTGLEVVLTDECWQHVVSRHPEMLPFKNLVLEAIRQPNGIYFAIEIRHEGFIGRITLKFQVSGTRWMCSSSWETIIGTSRPRTSSLIRFEC